MARQSIASLRISKMRCSTSELETDKLWGSLDDFFVGISLNGYI